MNTQNDAALVRHNGAGAIAPGGNMTSFIAQGAEFMKLASSLADSDIIPKEFRGKPANCFLALEMAHRLNLGPMEVMQNLYVVHGTPSMSSKFLIGLANRSGRFKGGLRFGVTDDAVRCYATDRETNEVLEVVVTMAQAKRAGWTKNAKYTEMGEQMLSYRAATFFVRRYCPEVMLGMMTVEEARELPREVQHAPDPLDALTAPLSAPDATGDGFKVQIHEESKSVPAPQYAPPDVVAKLVASFDAMGVPLEELEESFGPLDKMSERTFNEAREFGRNLKAKAEAAEKVPTDGMFPSGEESSYEREGA